MIISKKYCPETRAERGVQVRDLIMISYLL